MEASALLAGGVAHEFNNILAALSGTLQMVRECPVAGELVFQLASADRAIDRAAALTHILFGVEHGDGGERHAVEIDAIVDDVLSVIGSRFHKRGIEVVRPSGRPPAVASSRGALLQAVLLMLSAAERALDKVPGRIVITSGSSGRHAWLTVVDNGCGKSDDAAALRARVGNAGKVTIDAHPQEGTTRTVTLPLFEPHQAVLETAPATIEQGRLVLIVDDEKPIRKMLTVFFESRGFQVQTAENCEAASTQLDAHEFDLVLLDLVMPGTQGTVLLDRLKIERPSLPVIIISGESVDPSIEELHRRGATGVMRKPLRLERLLTACRAALRAERLPLDP